MNRVSSKESIVLTNEIIDYYEECWLTRFHAGHNPRSLAMHMGFFDEVTVDNEEAKLNMNTFLFQQLGLNAESKVSILDAGCGVGGTCFYLAEKFPNISVTGLNVSEQQVFTANQFKAEKTLAGMVDFVVGDYTDTSFEDGAFDVIYLVESLCHALDKSLVYKEAMRLLRPGGKLAILDYLQNTTELDEPTLSDLKDFQHGWAVRQYILNPKEQLAEVGFEEVDLKLLTPHVLLGIRLSAERSETKLKSPNGHAGNTLMIDHFKACTALHRLVDKKVIDYTLITCRKKD